MKKKSHWEFLESSSKARLCVYRLGKGWAQACGACTLLQHCLVNQLTAVAIPPPHPPTHPPPTHTQTHVRAQLGKQILRSPLFKKKIFWGVTVAFEFRKGFSYT